MRTPRKARRRPARTTPHDHIADDTVWPRVAQELADDLAADAPARDRAGKTPFDEVARLREAGLPGLLTAPGPGGPGADWHTACRVIREIAAADGSIGELLAHHCALSWATRLLPPGPDPSGVPAGEHGLLAGAVEPPRAESGDPSRPADLALTPAGDGTYHLTGRRFFASGVAVADRLVVGARCATSGDLLVVLADPAHPAVFTEPYADRVGQRLAGAGTVTFDRLPVATGQILGALPYDEHTVAPYAGLAPLALRLLLVHVTLGIAEGALAEARDVSRASRCAPPAPTAPERAAHTGPAPEEDPYLLLVYGELATAAHSAAAVVDRATEALAHGLLTAHDLGVGERSDIAVLVAAAETVAHRAATDITTRVLGLVAPRSPADPLGADPGFDRFWRNVRALTAPVSPDHRLRDIGDHYLHGTHPRLTLPV